MAERRRRSLSHAGGAVQASGEPRERAVAAAALEVSSDERSVMAHVHGFHSYPARLHPVTAARLVEGLSAPSARVLDPFCGSGTVLAEARRLGRRAFGLDANPLAIELAWLKTLAPSQAFTEALVAEAERITLHADERRRARAGPARRYGREDRELFEVHVLLELDGLRQGIEATRDAELQRALGLVLSALLTKLSRRGGDTSQHKAPRRLASGFAIRFFAGKTRELAERLRDYAATVPAHAPPATLRVGDARRLGRLSAVDLVVTSPPYPGVYDYLDQHRMRLRWLELEASRFSKTEIGARRTLSRMSFRDAVSAWESDFGACLAEMKRVLAVRGSIALVIADSALDGRALYADALVERLAQKAGLRVSARASQRRPLFHAPSRAAFRERPRAEHVLVLRHAVT